MRFGVLGCASSLSQYRMTWSRASSTSWEVHIKRALPFSVNFCLLWASRAIKSVNAIRIATLCKHHKDPFAYLVFLPTVRKAAVAHPILLTIADSSDPRRADPTRSSFQHARHQTQSHRAAHPHARASSTQDVHDPLPHRTRQQSECPTRSRTRISGPASAAAALK